MNTKNVHITVEENNSNHSYSDSIHRAQNLKIQVKYSYQKNKDQKPRRNKSAFIIFSGDARAKIKEVEGELNSNEMMVKLAERWKNLAPQERLKYDLLAKNDKERYQQELVEYTKFHPHDTLHNKTKHNHVKKPCSAYGIFLKDKKSTIKEQQPGLKMADVLKIVSEEWKTLPEAEKKRYQDIAFREKEAKTNELKEAFLKDQNTKDNVSVKVKNKKEKKAAPGKKTTKKVKKELKEEESETQSEIKMPKFEEDSVKVEHTPTPTLQTFSSHTISSGTHSGIWAGAGEIVYPHLKTEEMENMQIKTEDHSHHLSEDIPNLLHLYRHSSSLELMMNAGIFKKQSDSIKDALLSQFTKPAHRSSELLGEILKMDMTFDMPSVFDSTSFISKLKSESNHSISKFFDFNPVNGKANPNDMLKSLLLESEKNHSLIEAPSKGKMLNDTINNLLGGSKAPALRLEDLANMKFGDA